MTETITTVGIDCGRSSIFCCPLTAEPADLKRLTTTYKPVVLTLREPDVERLLALGQVYAIEPTGQDYWIWVRLLREAGKEVRIISGLRIRNHAKSHGILNKGDREDAAVIAHYAIKFNGVRDAFINLEFTDLNYYWQTLRSCNKQTSALINKVRARLVNELPHLAQARATAREWGKPQTGAMWRELAGQQRDPRGRKRKEPPRNLGVGKSWITEKLANFICEWEAFEAQIETELDRAIAADRSRSMQAFRQVLGDWGISNKPEIAILSAAHPFDQFLDNGKVVREWRWNAKGTGMLHTNRSLKAFQRSLAFGQIKVQSGGKEKLVPVGDRFVRDAMLNWLNARVVMGRQPNQATLLQNLGKPDAWDTWGKKERDRWIKANSFKELFGHHTGEPWNTPAIVKAVQVYNGSTYRVAQLQLFWECAPQCQNRSKWKRTKKTYSKLIRLLFNDLVKAYQALENSPELILL